MSDRDDEQPSGREEQPTDEQFALENLIPDLDPSLRDALARDREGSKQAEGSPASDRGSEAGPESEQAGEGEGAGQDPGDRDEPPGEESEAAETRPAMAPVAAPEPPGYVPGQPTRPGAAGDPERPPRRPRLFLSFFLAAFLIIASVAGASSATVILYLGDVASKLRENSLDVGGTIAPTSSGEPQTILIIGTDTRSSDDEDRPPLSDTAILLRLDPSQDAIALMSIPRDLRVEIPGVGIDKFNAAYAYGGPELTIRTIRRLTGGMEINHVVNVDFVGFIRAVDEINCLYMNIDRRYYHSNVGVPPHLQYAEIDIEPGYQKLCGEDALDYARYRHDDNDLVRAARQQEVLREARQRVGISKLISDRKELIEIFTDYTTSDIRETRQMVELINLLVDARNASIKEVQFPGQAEAPEPGQAAYVIAQPEEIRKAVGQFLGFEASGGARGKLDGAQRAEKGRPDRQERRRERRRALARSARQKPDGLVDASEGGRDVALTTAGQLGPGLPVVYPKRLPEGAIYAEPPHVYHLRDPDDNVYGAYVFVLQLLPGGDYFNVQGIRGWSDPPILEAPHETIEMRNRDFKVYLDGDRVRLVAWHIGPNSYWIANSLLHTLTNAQMLGMARSFGAVIPERKTRAERLAVQLGLE